MHKKIISALSALFAIFILSIVLIPCIALIRWPQTILRFERINPVYTETVNIGTHKEDLKLPESLRAVIPCSNEIDLDSFTQAKPETNMSNGYEHYDYYCYGYVAPKSASENYEANEKVIYSIYYADRDKNGDTLNTVGEVAYRIYGAVNDSSNLWFDCDEAGNINGVVLDIPVTWNDESYNADKPGIYTFTAKCKGYNVKQDMPVAKITVKEINKKSDEPVSSFEAEEMDENTDEPVSNLNVAENKLFDNNETNNTQEIIAKNNTHFAEDCHCGLDGEPIDADNFHWGHSENCIHFSPTECMCRKVLNEEVIDGETGKVENQISLGEITHIHDPYNNLCPLYGRDTVRIKKLATNEESVMGTDDAERIVASQTEGKVLYPALGNIEIITTNIQNAYGMRFLSANGGGANDVAQDNYMTSHTATSGNPTVADGFGSGTPGTWVDYVNTIWMNKAYNQFAWTANPPNTQNGWAWGGGTATQSRIGSIRTTQNTPNCIPSASNGTWTIYSGEQLLYALNNATSGQTITLGANINLNGSVYAWPQSNRTNITLDGNNKIIYNAGAYTSGTGDIAVFSTSSNGFKVQNLTFVTAKMVGGGRVMPIKSYSTSGNAYTNVHNINSLIYTTGDTAVGLGSLQSYNNTTRTNVTNCSVQGSYIRSRDHALGFAGSVGQTTITNSFVSDTLIDSYGGHSSGFIYCHNASPEVEVSNCFASTEIYGAKYVVGFGAPFGASNNARSINNCFATGKIEGYEYLSGFAAMQTSAQLDSYTTAKMTYNNCYSTNLVGMRSEAQQIGGFMAKFNEGGDGTVYIPAYINNCYAAGEVGNFTTNMDNPINTGGFLAVTDDKIIITNSYYDKQTTAMREWVAGNTKTVNGVTGVFTGNSKNADNSIVLGLASGNYATSGDGFKGFSNNNQWVYASGHYPQLNVFSNAATSAFGNYGNLVRAYSLASTSTVFLDTWDKGYDWNDTGVRTADKISYDRTLNSTGKTAHKGYDLTYDTVREIISPFTVTQNSNYSHLISGGAPSQFTDSDGFVTNINVTVNINDSSKTGDTENPGMDWYKISSTYSGQTGYRPIRLIGYMAIDAGFSETVRAGQKYNHRSEVELTMMKSLTPNLVIGIDDARVWSSSKQDGYPDSSKYYALPTVNMETDYSASKDAWIYTEIWRAKQNSDGSYAQDASYGYTDGTNNLVPDLSVKVTGEGTGNNETTDEQKWNGSLPLYPDTSVERKYIISYYWMLSDGRYDTDYRIVTIEPGKYNLTLDVLSFQNGEKSDPENNNALYIGTGIDTTQGETGYSLSDTTSSHNETTNIGYTVNTAAAWKKCREDVSVAKMQIDLYSSDVNGEKGTLMGTSCVEGNLKAGNSIIIPTIYPYITTEHDDYQNRNREITETEKIDVTYTIAQKEDGTFYLRFNKLANVPDDEINSAKTGTNDASGIPAGTHAYINDTVFHTEITLWVTSGTDFEFIKTDKEGNTFSEGEAEFQLYSCTYTHNSNCGGLIDPSACNHQHSLIAANEPGNCWAVEGDTVLTTETDENGKVCFEKLPSGDYMLAETKTKVGYQLPTGQWLIHVSTDAEPITITARGETPPAFKIETVGNAATLKLPNYRILTMPYSGGLGVILFTIGGIVLIGIAIIIMIITRKKKDSKEK